MTNTATPYAGETTLRWAGTSLRTRTYTDISPELILEAMVRVEVHAVALGSSPQRNGLPSRFRKRLANTRTS